MVVDDHPGVRFLLKKALEDDGYQVRALASGEEAFAEVLRHPPAVLLLDLDLPDWRSLRILDELGKLRLGIPVVLLTDWDDGELFRCALERGVVGYLVKPFDLDDLRKLIREALALSPCASGDEAGNSLM